MDVKAILVVGETDRALDTRNLHLESFAGQPLAVMDVLGKPVIARIAERLQRYGINQFSTVCDQATANLLDGRLRRELNVVVEQHGLWRSAETVFNEYVQQGAELVLVVRVGPYAEIDFEEFIQFHLEHHGRATVAVDARGYRIGTVALAASRRNDAAYLFRHNMEEFRVPCQQYQFHGYMNRLITPTDLRQLSVDALLQRNSIQPIGKQIRPGVWAAPSARIHPRARIVAPAFIGERVKLRASAVITRFTSVEHHAVVDCGTVLENATITPYTYVGAGLDVNYAVVGQGRIASLRRNVEVEIRDPKLLSTISASAPLRALREASALATYLPQQVIRGMFARSKRTMPAEVPAAVQTPSPSLKEPARNNPGAGMNPAPEFSSDFAVARRYGNE